MPENKNPSAEKNNNVEAPKKRSFFWWSLDIHAKDLLDFRYNTQEEIDKLNEEMTTTSDLDEIINQTSNSEDIENIDNKNEKYPEEKDENNNELNLENDKQSINEPWNNNYTINYEDKNNKPIEWEIVNSPDEDNNEEAESVSNTSYWTTVKSWEDKVEEKINIEDEIKIEELDKDSEKINENGGIKTEDNAESEENNNIPDNENSKENDIERNETEFEELWDSVKFFDPFELNLDEDEYSNEESETNNMFDPFGLNEDNDEEIEEDNDEEIEDDNDEEVEDEETENEENVEEANDKEIEDNNEEEVDNDNDEEVDDDNDEEIEEDNDEEVDDYNDEEVEEDNDDEEVDEDNDEEVDEDIVINTPIAVNPNQKDEKEELNNDRKIKKNSVTWETITNEEIELEQWQDLPTNEDDEEYQPSAEEIFEQEPEFFADDELSQQFMHLVQNVRGIFKLERKDWEQNPYFKILWWKTKDSTLEYLFYLIEEEDEPIDLYIKKVETNQEDENEHLVQFSYNKDKELNIFVDEVILYERINKSDPNNTEYNDTKTILEKFIFLTDNHYDKLKSELDKIYEEKKKKKQLQQIFKGF